jgi:hypothetical protein
MDNPNLIEPNVKYHLYKSLTKCHDNRVNIYTWILNIGIFVIFVGVVGCTLYYCWTRKVSPEEKYNKMMRDQAYILSKIQYYQNERMNMPLSTITSLPIVAPLHIQNAPFGGVNE